MAQAVPFLDSPPLYRYGSVPTVEYGTSPAAAADFIQPITGRYFVRLLTVFARLVTDANVAERQLFIDYRDDADRRFAIAGAPVGQDESTTTDYAFQAFVGQSDWPIDGVVLVTLPPLILSPGYDWRIGIANGEAGDQISAVRWTSERFYTGAPPE